MFLARIPLIDNYFYWYSASPDIVPDEELRTLGQSVDGRLWDILWMFRCSARRNASDIMFFDLYFLMNKNGKPERKLVTLKAVCGPGDNGETVITIMKPDED